MSSYMIFQNFYIVKAQKMCYFLFLLNRVFDKENFLEKKHLSKKSK